MPRPGTAVFETANDRFKRGFSSWLWAAMILATIGHFGLFYTAPDFGVEDITFRVTDVSIVDIPDEIRIPDAPPAIARPATPVVAEAPVSTELTIPLTTLEANPVENLPAPPAREAEPDLAAAPAFTPMTVRPRLLNGDEVARILTGVYPPLLRDAGIGGTVDVWFFIDETGRVVKTQVHRSSGYDAFDRAALEVADRMRFSPAYNRDQRVPVWVSLSVLFEVQK